MKNFGNLLDNVSIASPCPADWNEMSGNERQRYCSDCKLNVYNLSNMTKFEAEDFLMNAEGRVCVRYYRRDDGSILTKDCPVGREAFRKRLRKKANAFLALCTGIFGGLVAYVQLQPTRNTQTNLTNSTKSVETKLPPVVIETKKSEPEKKIDLDGRWGVGMLIERVPPEKQNIKTKKIKKGKKPRR